MYLSINMAMTLDGKVARPDGKWHGLSSKNDKRQMDVVRADAEAVIVGKNSIINDDPVIRLRYTSGKNPRPVMIIRSGIVPAARRLFTEAENESKPLIFCTEANRQELENELNSLAEIIALGVKDATPAAVMAKLAEKGFNRILLEGGPKLNHAFVAAGLVNRINLTLVPFLIGQNNLPAIVDGNEPFAGFDTNNWNLVSCRPVENEVFLVYEKK